jgi:hypothetical protein
MWEAHQDFSDLLSEAWKRGEDATTLSALQVKLGRLSVALAGWDKHMFGHVQQLRDEPTQMAPTHAELKIVDPGPTGRAAPPGRIDVEAESETRVAKGRGKEYPLLPPES